MRLAVVGIAIDRGQCGRINAVDPAAIEAVPDARTSAQGTVDNRATGGIARLAARCAACVKASSVRAYALKSVRLGCGVM
jgi:hypothetical protein